MTYHQRITLLVIPQIRANDNITLTEMSHTKEHGTPVVLDPSQQVLLSCIWGRDGRACGRDWRQMGGLEAANH